MPPDDSPAGEGAEPPVHQLLARMRAGDVEATRAFCVRMEPFLRRVSHRWITDAVRRQADSMDITQSVIRRMVGGAAPDDLVTDGRVLAWAAAVVRNRIHTIARHRRESGPLEAAEALPAEAADPAALVAEAEELNAFHDALKVLAPDEQKAVLLHDFDGEDFERVARALGRPSADAARKVHDRAIKRLGKLLEKRR
jgi:RNA polymerase sigma factor (sigma-70 family)